MHTENPCLPASVRRRNHRRYSLYRNLSGTALYPEWLCPLLLVQRQPGGSSLFTVQKTVIFIAIDYRTAPHQKCRNLMQLNKSSLSPAPTQMYFNLCRRLQAKKKLIESCLYMRYFAYRTWQIQQAKSRLRPVVSSRFSTYFGNEEKTSSAISL